LNVQTTSVTGDLRAFSIFDVTQSLMMGRKSAEVIVQSGNRKGFLWFLRGQIVAALDDRLQKGEPAATRIFAWRGGSFSINFEAVIEQKNIHVATDCLLLEVARNLDEVRRDQGLDEEVLSDEEQHDVANEVQERLEDKLRHKLNNAFHQVATSMEPARVLFRSDAFDEQLRSLLKMEGNALFLQPGRRPLVRSERHFKELSAQTVKREELELYLNAILSEEEQLELKRRREVVAILDAGELGSFRLHAVRDSAGLLLTFTPAMREALDLRLLCPDICWQKKISALREGLVVVAGPLGSGKPAFVASMARHQMQEHEAFVLLFSSSQAHAIHGPRGYCINRETPAPGPGFHTALRAALEQDPDVLGLSGTADQETLRDAFHVALGAAGSRLVIYSLDSQSPGDTLTRLLRLAHTQAGDPLLDSLAATLKLVVDLKPGDRSRPEIQQALEVDQGVRQELQSGNLARLKEHLLLARPA